MANFRYVANFRFLTLLLILGLISQRVSDLARVGFHSVGLLLFSLYFTRLGKVIVLNSSSYLGHPVICTSVPPKSHFSVKKSDKMKF